MADSASVGTQDAGRPLPVADDITAGFWDAARAHQLQIQRCQSCSRFIHAPSVTCPSCGSEQTSYQQVSGRGTVYSYTVLQDAPAPGFRGMLPLVVAVIELVEQPRLFMVANLPGVDPARVRIGLDVEVTFEDIGEGCVLPQFRPAGA